MDVLEFRRPPKQGVEFISTILDIVSKHQNIPVTTIYSRTRKREIVFARQLAMTLSKELTNCSLEKIGLVIGNKDHATVLHAKKTIRNLSDTDSNILGTYNNLYFKAISQIKEQHILICPYCGSNNIFRFAMKSIRNGTVILSDSDTDYTCIDCNETYFKPIIEK